MWKSSLLEVDAIGAQKGYSRALRGVEKVDQGFVQSDAPADTWAEAVIVTFDPSVIKLVTLSRSASQNSFCYEVPLAS